MGSQDMEKTYIEASLPVLFDGQPKLKAEDAFAFGKDLSEHYAAAQPYPHIVIDKFLPETVISHLEQHFPKEKVEDEKVFMDGYAGLLKRQVMPESCDDSARTMFYFFNSAPMLKFLEGLTGIDALIGDPYFAGGGFHEMFRGGKLGIHADFRINKELHLNRRVNMLIYLNRDWDNSYGGSLEIWDDKVKTKFDSIAPIFNRCVVFNTDAGSNHGHPDPLNTPPEISRRSVALYYYTASRGIYNETPGHSTMYVARPGDPTSVRRGAAMLRLQNYMEDWLPPVLFRALQTLKRSVKK